MAEEQIEEKIHKVTVTVPTRVSYDGTSHAGYGAAWRYWPTGSTEALVSEKELGELKRVAASGAPLVLSVQAEEEAKVKASLEAKVAKDKASLEAKVSAKK
jgi:hypothetical protein